MSSSCTIFVLGRQQCSHSTLKTNPTFIERWNNVQIAEALDFFHLYYTTLILTFEPEVADCDAFASRKRVASHRTPPWTSIARAGLRFPRIYWCTHMKKVISALLCHLQIHPSYFRIDVIIPQILNIWACFRRSDTSVHDKPGTNLNKMVDLSSNRRVLGH